MDKALFVFSFLAIVFLSALLISSYDSIHLAHACPAKSSGTTASNVNPIISSNLNTPLPQSHTAPSQLA
jgi:hypothetical protein